MGAGLAKSGFVRRDITPGNESENDQEKKAKALEFGKAETSREGERSDRGQGTSENGDGLSVWAYMV
jgi:hypothetical protein